MSKLNITKGKWVTREDSDPRLKGCFYVAVGKSPIAGIVDRNTEESNGNAILIADAGTTFNKCSKLPSELLAENEELKEAIKFAAKTIDEKCFATAAYLRMVLTKYNNQ